MKVLSLLRELSPGRLRMRYKRTFGHGLTTAYYRDIVRWRILSTRPVAETTDNRCEVHAVTSRNDWLNLIWTLKTFYFYSERRYALCIHDDGTLAPKQLNHLRRHFPAARVIKRADADRTVAPLLADLPRSQAFRATNPLALKVFDTTAYLRSERMLLLDCDLLFFAAPTEVLRRVDDPTYSRNSFNSDWANGYSVGPEKVQERTGVILADRVNSGLGLVHKSSLDFGTFEEFLAIPGIMSHNWRIEQTLIALYSSRHGYEPLPGEYTVRLGPDDPAPPSAPLHQPDPPRDVFRRDSSAGWWRLWQPCEPRDEWIRRGCAETPDMSDTMNIALVAPDFPPEIGGMQTYSATRTGVGPPWSSGHGIHQGR